MTSSAEWGAPSEAQARLTEALAASDGFPVPTEVEFAGRVIEQLAGRGYRLAPVLARRRTFVPALAPGSSTKRVMWMHTHCSHTEAAETANKPPDKICPACEERDEPWVLLYVEVIEDVDTQESKDGS